MFGLLDYKNINEFLINATFINQSHIDLTLQQPQVTQFIDLIKILYIWPFIGLTLVIGFLSYLFRSAVPPYFFFSNLIEFFHCLNPISKIKNRENIIKAKLFNFYSLFDKKSNTVFIILYFIFFALISIFTILTFAILFFSADSPSLSPAVLVKGVLVIVIQCSFFIVFLKYFNNSMIFNENQEKILNLNNIKQNIESDIFSNVQKNTNISEALKDYKLLSIYQFKRISLFFFENSFLITNPNSLKKDNKEIIRQYLNYNEEKDYSDYSLKQIAFAVVIPGWFYLPLVMSIFFNLPSPPIIFLLLFAVFGIFCSTVIYGEMKEG